MYRIRPLSAQGADSSAITRAALIKAAAPLFAENGFEATRTRDIADKAKANVSAINYHFGSKMGLYQAVIKEHADQMIANYPQQPAEVKDKSPEEQFQAMVRNILRRVLLDNSPKSLNARLCVREFAEPTEALDFLVSEIISKEFATTREVVSSVLGRQLNDAELDRLTISVGSQCFYYRLANPMLQRLGVALPETEEQIDDLATHISRFSLAGLRACAA